MCAPAAGTTQAAGQRRLQVKGPADEVRLVSAEDHVHVPGVLQHEEDALEAVDPHAAAAAHLRHDGRHA